MSRCSIKKGWSQIATSFSGAGPNIEEAEGSTSVYKSSATQPVRQVNVQTGLFGEEQITLGKLMNWYSERRV